MRFTKELKDIFVSEVASSVDSVKKICERRADLPDVQTVYVHLRSDPEFFEAYMQAKKAQAHLYVDEIVNIANEVEHYHDDRGNKKIDQGMLGKARLKIDILKWAAGKLAPKNYADTRFEEFSTQELDEEAIARKRELDEKYKKDY